MIFSSLVLSWINRESPLAYQLICGSTCSLGISLVIFLIPWTMHALPERRAIPGALIFFAITGGGCFIYYMALTSSAGMAYIRGTDPLNMRFPILSSYMLFLLLLCAIVYSFVSFLKDKGLKKRRYPEWTAWRDFLYFSLVLVPLMALLVWFRGYFPVLRNRPRETGAFVQFLFYGGFSVTVYRVLLSLKDKRILTVDCPELSNRELQVASLLAGGHTYSRVAEELCISIHTVQSHVKNIYRKTGVNSKVELCHRMNTIDMGYEDT